MKEEKRLIRTTITVNTETYNKIKKYMRKYGMINYADFFRQAAIKLIESDKL